MILPQGSTIDSVTLEEVEQPSLTYGMDFTKKCVTKKIDGLEALKQAVFIILSTERFEHLIYSHDHGFESMSVAEEVIFRSEIQRRVREALMQDDRILDVVDFETKIDGDSSFTEFTVVSKFGDFRTTKRGDR
ncbi:DUF2634 domain-containing protein [Brevibacillus laterosporus]|uniref:DUF2634 domain-containing protein n=1 Tax=Brevibacillus laterosporus TaxID=1465 RepID=UPI0003B1AE60|nr:DUF2634 domain-containing protein [Brevibacillus laterosporus]ERM20354.1 hypothetical protein P615_00165 [Brevibacillus laterosporus PE36]